MRINWNIIKLFLVSICATVLYGFSNLRSEDRKVRGMSIQFVSENNVYLTEAAVNKLLIQNYGPVINQPKERVDLNTIEQLIQANTLSQNPQGPMVITHEPLLDIGR